MVDLPRYRSAWLAAMALLGVLVGCKTNPRPQSDAQGVGGPAALESDRHPSATATRESATPGSTGATVDSDPRTRLELETVRRNACLRAPLSPSADELPYLGEYRHVVPSNQPTTHLFHPPHGKFFDATRQEASLQALTARFPEFVGLSMRRCGHESHRGKIPKPICVHWEVPICEPWLPQAERLVAAAAPEGLSVQVEIVGRTSPRCSGDACLPLGYHDRTTPRADQTWSGWFTLPYRAADARAPLLPELAKGTCGGDGDCVIAGCGNHCEGWTEPPHEAHCPAYQELADAHCGCITNACSWFVQSPLLELKADVEVSGWPPAPRRDVAAESGTVVFRRLLQAPWLRRQLERAQHERHVTVPSEFALTLTLDRQFQVASAHVTVADAPGPAWLEEILRHLPVPVPETSVPARPGTGVRVGGRVVVASK